MRFAALVSVCLAACISEAGQPADAAVAVHEVVFDAPFDSGDGWDLGDASSIDDGVLTIEARTSPGVTCHRGSAALELDEAGLSDETLVERLVIALDFESQANHPWEFSARIAYGMRLRFAFGNEESTDQDGAATAIVTAEARSVEMVLDTAWTPVSRTIQMTGGTGASIDLTFEHCPPDENETGRAVIKGLRVEAYYAASSPDAGP